jgi:hypothetical protein
MFRIPEIYNPLLSLTIAVICAVGLFHRASAQTPTPVEVKQMRIKIGSKTFMAILEENAAAAAFKAMLPLTVEMTELNGNEKYARLSKDLPVKATNPGTIQTGDLMIYGSRTLVLFYKTFRTSYEYTRLGRIQDTTGLAAAVGSGSVVVTFAMD